MFTGLVRSVGVIDRLQNQAEGKEIAIADHGLDAADTVLGASVAIGGVCLTVTGSTGGLVHFEAAFETLAKTTLGQLAPGSRVNLEPALRVGDPLGGHLVSGHVDGIATLESITARGEARELWVACPESLARFIAPKGSVTVDGVSLTVNDVEGARFMLGIIPHTLAHTTLGERRVGDRLNIEVDVLARYVARLLEAGEQPRTGLSLQDLQAAGFDRGSGGTT